jgi:hypothetical protein
MRSASTDPAVLKAFISAHPKGAQAGQVRGRLRSLEPLRRKVMGSIVPLFLLLVSLASAGTWLLGVLQPKDDTCTEARQLRQIAGFTLVKDVFVIGKGRESYRRDDIKDPFQFANDCAASCRTRSWCKGFWSYSRSCEMYEGINTQEMPSDRCWWWFRRN